MSHEQIVDLYERHAASFDRDRSRSLFERTWLERFVHHLAPAATVLDIGCGMGEPIARYFIEHGVNVVGIDSSRSMIDLCRTRFPSAEWLVADMRGLSLERRFEGVLAWDSFFHLSMGDQRAMFPRFAAHARPGAPLMFTPGPREGDAIGSYERLLTMNGFVVKVYQAEDPECGGHTVWLARFEP